MINEQKLKKALENLVNKLEEVHENEKYRSVWTMNQMRYGSYTGPTYAQEFESAKEVLKELQVE